MNIKRFNEMNEFPDKDDMIRRFKKAKERGDSYISMSSLMTPEEREKYANRKPEKKNVFIDDEGGLQVSFIENKYLKKLHDKGEVLGEKKFSEVNPFLQNAIVNYLNEKLPTLWDGDDAFKGRVTVDGLKKGSVVIQYEDHMEFIVDSDRYRICICLIIKGKEAYLFEY